MMPTLNFDELAQILTPEELKLAQMIVCTQGKNKDCIRASKPKPPKMKEYPGGTFGTYFDYENEEDAKKGMAAFLWRHVVFTVSPNPQHQEISTDILYLPYRKDRDEQQRLVQWLMDLADKITRTIPTEQHYGTIRWGKILGYF